MTERKPTYATDPQSPARQALLRAAALDNARAAREWLLALVGYADTLIDTSQRWDASDNALTAAFNEAHGLNLGASALAAGLPEATR